MKSILLIISANLRRRKLQNILIGSCIALGATLFATTLTLLNSMDRPFDQMFDQLHASHLLLFFDPQQQDTKPLVSWFRDQEEVESVSKGTPYYALEEPILFKGTEVDLLVQLMEHQEENLEQDQVRIIQGTPNKYPAPGEIWIPIHLARNHHIQVGDTLGIPLADGLYPMIVSATVVDPHFASSLFNPTRAWVAPGALSYFLSIHQLNKQMVGVRLKSAEDAKVVWSRFNQDHLFEGKVLEYQLFRSVFLSFYQIISFVLLIFSVLAIVAAVFILYITLSAAISADLQLIGVYRAQGLTPKDIIWVYVLQNIILALISLPVGLLGSYFLTKVILRSLVSSLGMVHTGISFLGPLAISFLLLLMLVILIALLGSWRIRKVKPVAAIRMDSSQSHRTISIPRFSPWLMKPWMPVPFYVGLQFLMARPRRLVYTGLSLLFTIFILIFSINISHSFAGLKDNKAAWGLEDADLQVRLNKKIALPLEYQDFLAFLQKDSSIAAVVPYAYCEGSLLAEADKPEQNLNGKVYTGNITDIGLNNLEGRHPVTEAEIALCVLTAKENRKAVGDSLELFIEGQVQRFLVTGVYQDVSNLGKGFRLAGPAMEALYPLFEPEFYALKLRDSRTTEDYKKQLQKQFGETLQIELSVEDRKGIKSTVSGMQSTLTLVALFFLSIVFAVLLNDTLMNLQEFRKSFGLFKTIGMTPFQIRMALVAKAFIISLMALAFGIPLAMIISPMLISGITGGIGLQQFPYWPDAWGTFLAIPGFLVFTGASVWFTSRRVLRVSPKDLINE